MNPGDKRYADMADAAEGRNYHDVRMAYKDRMGTDMAFGRAWLKFNPGADLIYVDDAEGRPRALTPKQYAVLVMALDIIRRTTRMTMRQMAEALGVAPSTVSRALTKLQSWGLVGVIVGRGRFAGLVIFRRTKDDGMDRFRKAAKARVWAWKKAAEARVSRLWINVAPYIHDGSGTAFSDQYHYHMTITHKSATLKAWTPDELREAGIL